MPNNIACVVSLFSISGPPRDLGHQQNLKTTTNFANYLHHPQLHLQLNHPYHSIATIMPSSMDTNTPTPTAPDNNSSNHPTTPENPLLRASNPLVSDLEQEVLDEYARLLGNVNKVFQSTKNQKQ